MLFVSSFHILKRIMFSRQLVISLHSELNSRPWLRAALTRLFTQQVYSDVTVRRWTPRNNNGVLQQIVRGITHLSLCVPRLPSIHHINIKYNYMKLQLCHFIGLQAISSAKVTRFIMKLRNDIVFVYRCLAQQLWYTRLDVQPVSGNQPGFSSFLAFEKILSFDTIR